MILTHDEEAGSDRFQRAEVRYLSEDFVASKLERPPGGHQFLEAGNALGFVVIPEVDVIARPDEVVKAVDVRGCVVSVPVDAPSDLLEAVEDVLGRHNASVGDGYIFINLLDGVEGR